MTADDSRTMRRAFAEFARTAADALAIHPLPIADDIGRAFRRAAAAPLRETKSDGALPHFAPAGKRLRAMINDFFGSVATTNSPLYFAAARLSPHLFWRTAGNGKAPAAAAELIGPSGMAKCSQLRAGLFFQPAEMFYEWHRHAAEEIYLPLGAVSAEWLTAGAPPARIRRRDMCITVRGNRMQCALLIRRSPLSGAGAATSQWNITNFVQHPPNNPALISLPKICFWEARYNIFYAGGGVFGSGQAGDAAGVAIGGAGGGGWRSAGRGGGV